jgi:hypothetical protein
MRENKSHLLGKSKIKIAICIVIIILLLMVIIVEIVIGKNRKNEENTNNSRTDINQKVSSIDDIDDVYNSEIAKEYTDIRKLSKDYTVEQAQQDNCFVIGAMVHNDNLYSEFMSNFNDKKSSFIRVVQTTIEGDLYIIDLLYDTNSNKIYLVKDDTRDEFLTQEDRTIKYKTYEKTGVWNYQNSEYWVTYNGELPDGTNEEYNINSDELFIIATIN